MCSSLPASYAGCQGCRQRTPAQPSGLRSPPRSGPWEPALPAGSAAVPCCASSRRLGATVHTPICSSSWQPPPQGRTSLLGQCPAGTRSPEAEPALRAGWACVSCSCNYVLGSAQRPGMQLEDPQAAHCRQTRSHRLYLHSCGASRHCSPCSHVSCWAHSHENRTLEFRQTRAWVRAAPVPAATVARISRH